MATKLGLHGGVFRTKILGAPCKANLTSYVAESGQPVTRRGKLICTRGERRRAKLAFGVQGHFKHPQTYRLVSQIPERIISSQFVIRWLDAAEHRVIELPTDLELWELGEHELKRAMRAIAAVLLLTATPFQRGSDALLQRDCQTVVAAFTESIEAEPTAKAYVNRGTARLGNLKEAFDDSF